MTQEQKKEQLRLNKLHTITNALHKHASGCKKPFGDCRPCQRGVEWFGSLSDRDLSIVLAEPPVRRRA